MTASKKGQYLRLRAMSKNFTYARYAAFFETRQVLILNFLQSRQIATFYKFIKRANNSGYHYKPKHEGRFHDPDQ